MKTLQFSILLLVNFSVACFSQNNSFDVLGIGPQTWSTPPATTISNTSEIDLAGLPDNVTVNGTANVDVISAQEIHMLPGFTAGSFTGNGLYVAQINTSEVPIAIISPDLEARAPICQFERLEIGVGIPTGLPDLQTDIDNFTQYPQYPTSASWPPTYPSGVINPFDPNELKIEALFTGIDPNGNQKIFIRDGYYTQDVSVTNPLSATENFDVEDDPAYPFRVRFAPPFPGEWTVTITITVNNTQTFSSLPGTFNVGSCSNNQGFITTDQYSQSESVRGNWHFMYDDNNYGSGNTFFPLGEDLIGAIEHNAYGWNSSYSHEISSNPDPSVIVNGNVAWSMSNDNYDYIFHRYEIKNVANMGGNFVRMVMYDGSYGIEDGSPAICDFDPVSSYELDSTLQMAESENLYLLLSMESEQNISPDNLNGPAETWGSVNPILSAGTVKHYWNPYYEYLANVEGMSSPDVSNYFSDPYLMYFYENKLRYINARWGYSPNIFGYEFYGEVDHAGISGGVPAYSSEASTILPAISNWTYTMTNYIHGMYPFHIVTMGYASIPKYTPLYNDLTDYSPEYVDFLDQHMYSSALPENSDRAPYFLDKYYYPTQNYGQTVIEKPRIIGEEAVSCGNVEPSGVGNSNVGCASALVRHNDEWASAFISSGAGFFWASNFDPTSNMIDYVQIGDFFNYLNTQLGINFQNTHFSSINQYNNVDISGAYTYQDFYLVDAAAKSDADPNDNSPASDISMEIGWVSNTEYNWEYNPSGCVLGCGTATPTISGSLAPSLLDVQDNSSYNVYVWDPYTDVLQGMYTENTTLSHSINFPLNLGTTPYTSPEPDYAYYFYRTGPNYSAVFTNPDSTKVIILPNDTIYLPSDSLSFPDSKYFPGMGGNFEWDFGNGMTSTKPDSKWIYTSIGEYPLTVTYKDSIKKIKIEQTYVVLENKKTEIPTDSAFTLVPNPTSGIFTIFAKGSYSIQEFDVEDATGRKCFSVLSPKDNIFNLGGFASGIYIVHIKSNGIVITKKLIKCD